MESDGIAVVVRNTFLHYADATDNEQHGRSNSAPPSCRHGVKEKAGNFGTSAASTTGEQSALDSDSDDVSVSSIVTKDELDSPTRRSSASATNRWSSEIDSDDEAVSQQQCQYSLAPAQQQPSQESDSAQQQLEEMTAMVMDIWSQLRLMESSIEAGDATLAEVKTSAPTKITAEVKSPAPTQTTRLGQKLDAKVRPFVPSSVPIQSEVHNLLASVGQILRSAHGVVDVDVKFGPAGTLATITVQVDSSASKASVINASKSALLEVAAGSQNTYVLGYEAQPFQEDVGGSCFCTALATLPAAWECSACWDTYSLGFCPRTRSATRCKWQHPGRSDLQPVRVVVC